jgi:hypothetical protein
LLNNHIQTNGYLKPTLLGNGYIDPRVSSMTNYNPVENYSQHYLAGAYSP